VEKTLLEDQNLETSYYSEVVDNHNCYANDETLPRCAGTLGTSNVVVIADIAGVLAEMLRRWLLGENFAFPSAELGPKALSLLISAGEQHVHVQLQVVSVRQDPFR
jgi:hypothetical protein